MKKYLTLIAVVIIGGLFAHGLLSQESSKPTIKPQGQTATGTLIQARQAFVQRFGNQLRKEYQAVQKEYPLVARYVALQEVSWTICARPAEETPASCEPQNFVTEVGFRINYARCLNDKCERDLLRCMANPDPGIRPQCLEEYSQCRGTNP